MSRTCPVPVMGCVARLLSCKTYAPMRIPALVTGADWNRAAFFVFRYRGILSRHQGMDLRIKKGPTETFLVILEPARCIKPLDWQLRLDVPTQ